MAAKPVFVGTPKEWHVRISTANTNRDGTGTAPVVASGGASGSRIERVTITATATTTAGMVRLFLNDGSNIRAFIEVPITAITPSASLPAFTKEVVHVDPVSGQENGQPLCNLPSGWSLLAAPHNAETFDVSAVGGDY